MEEQDWIIQTRAQGGRGPMESVLILDDGMNFELCVSNTCRYEDIPCMSYMARTPRGKRDCKVIIIFLTWMNCMNMYSRSQFGDRKLHVGGDKAIFGGGGGEGDACILNKLLLTDLL